MAWKFVGRRAWSGSATSSKGEPAGAVCRTIHGLDCGSRRSRGQVDSRRHMGRPSLPAPSAAAAPCAREPPTAGGGRGDGKVQRRAARYHPATAAAAVRDGQKKRPSIWSPAYFAACAEMRDAKDGQRCRGGIWFTAHRGAADYCAGSGWGKELLQANIGSDE